jgi:hypothetical protein
MSFPETHYPLSWSAVGCWSPIGGVFDTVSLTEWILHKRISAYTPHRQLECTRTAAYMKNVMR